MTRRKPKALVARDARIAQLASKGMRQYLIAKHLGMSRQRVHQILKALKKPQPAMWCPQPPAKCPVCGKELDAGH